MKWIGAGVKRYNKQPEIHEQRECMKGQLFINHFINQLNQTKLKKNFQFDLISLENFDLLLFITIIDSNYFHCLAKVLLSYCFALFGLSWTAGMKFKKVMVRGAGGPQQQLKLTKRALNWFYLLINWLKRMN